jgi:hypothetical protein
MHNLLRWSSRLFLPIWLCTVLLSFLGMPIFDAIAGNGLFILPIAIIIMVATTPSASTAVQIWKWILGISAGVISLPIGALAYREFLLTSMHYNDVDLYSLGLMILIMAGTILLSFETLGLIITEEIKKHRRAGKRSGASATTSEAERKVAAKSH